MYSTNMNKILRKINIVQILFPKKAENEKQIIILERKIFSKVQ